MASVGCRGPSAYKAPVTKFRDASAVVIEATKDYLTALNKTERDHFIEGQVASGSPIPLVELREKHILSPEAIAVRLEALDVLANYTELLYRLTTSDSPNQVSARAKDLGTALQGLSGKVSALTGADDARFKDAVGKVAPIVGNVLQAFVNQRIEEALRQAIATGAGPVNELIQAIRIDAETAYERKRSALSQRRGERALAYNTEADKGSGANPAKLRELANAVSLSEDRWEAFMTARPAVGLDAMQRANEALVKFASTPRPSVTDFASFVDAVESFAAIAARVGEAVHTLRTLTEGDRQ
jgi:hypothetical protein